MSGVWVLAIMGVFPPAQIDHVGRLAESATFANGQCRLTASTGITKALTSMMTAAKKLATLMVLLRFCSILLWSTRQFQPRFVIAVDDPAQRCELDENVIARHTDQKR